MPVGIAIYFEATGFPFYLAEGAIASILMPPLTPIYPRARLLTVFLWAQKLGGVAIK